MSLFSDQFNEGIPDFLNAAGEEWTFESNPYVALQIDEVTIQQKSGLGGLLADVSAVMYITVAEFEASGITYGSRIQANGQNLRVLKFGDDSTDVMQVYLGPVAAFIPHA